MMRLLGDYFLFSDPARLLFVVSAFSYGVFFFLLSVSDLFFCVSAFSATVFLLSVLLSVASIFFFVSAFSATVFLLSVLLSDASLFFSVAAFSAAVFLLSVLLRVASIFFFDAAFSASVFLLSVLLRDASLFFSDAAFSASVFLLSVASIFSRVAAFSGAVLSITFFALAAFFLFFSPRVPTPGAFFDWPVTFQYCCPSLILSENHAAISGVISSRRPSSLNFAKSVSKVPAGPPKCTNKSAMPRMKRSVSHRVDPMDVAKHM